MQQWLPIIILVLSVGGPVFTWIVNKIREQALRKKLEEERRRREIQGLRTGRVDASGESRSFNRAVVNVRSDDAGKEQQVAAAYAAGMGTRVQPGQASPGGTRAGSAAASGQQSAAAQRARLIELARQRQAQLEAARQRQAQQSAQQRAAQSHSAAPSRTGPPRPGRSRQQSQASPINDPRSMPKARPLQQHSGQQPADPAAARQRQVAEMQRRAAVAKRRRELEQQEAARRKRDESEKRQRDEQARQPQETPDGLGAEIASPFDAPAASRAAMAAGPRSLASAGPSGPLIARALQDRDNLRTAIILTEILGPPKADQPL